MQFTSFLVITTAALLAMGDAANPHYFGTRWLFINRPGSKRQFSLGREDLNAREVNSEENIFKTQNVDVAYNDVKVKYLKKQSAEMNDNNEESETNTGKEVKHSNEGARKKQWHNYPRRLDKLQRFKRAYGSEEPVNSDEPRQENEIPVSYSNLEEDLDWRGVQTNKELYGDGNSLNDLENDLVGDLTPILILKIRLSILRNMKAQHDEHLRKNKRIQDLDKLNEQFDVIDTDETEELPDYDINESFDSFPSWRVDPEIETIYITRGRLPTSQSHRYYPADSVDRRRRSRNQKNKRSDPEHSVSKRIFSFLTRMQGMHSAKDIEHRRHFHSYAGYPSFDSNGDIVSAETRALIRPPGSPLRWG